MWFPSGQSLIKAYCFVIFGIFVIIKIFVIFFLFVIFNFKMIFFIFEIFDICISNLIVVPARRLVFLSRLVTGSHKILFQSGLVSMRLSLISINVFIRIKALIRIRLMLKMTQ